MEGSHALITGGASGLGLSLAKKLAKRGFSVTILDLQDASAAVGEVKEAATSSARVQAVTADVSNYKELETAVKQAEEAFGPIDLLAACAGVFRDKGPIYDTPVEAFPQTMNVNFLGLVYAAKLVLPSMLSRGKGHILLVASSLATVPVACTAGYSCSKAAVKAFADVLRLETLDTGVKVHVALPGTVETPLLHCSDTESWKIRMIAAVEDSPILSRLFPTEEGSHVDQVTGEWLKGMDHGTYSLPFPKWSVNALNQIHAGLVAPGPMSWSHGTIVAFMSGFIKVIMRFLVETMARTVVPRKPTLAVKEE